MFLLRIAGDVRGQKRNIEVTFPRRPTLQEICSVAETILPLLGRRERRPWHPPGPLNGSAVSTANDATAGAMPASKMTDRTNGLFDLSHRDTESADDDDYVVESIAVVNPATRQWEEVLSAAQLSFGAQVYCFCPMQRRRVALVQPRRNVVSSARLPLSSSSAEVMPVVEAEVREHWASADRPAAIPEPQQRLVWDFTSAQLHKHSLQSVRGSGNMKETGRGFSYGGSPDNSRNLSRGLDDTAATAFSARRVASASPFFDSHSPSAIQPSYLHHERSISEPPLPAGRVRKQSDSHGSSLIDYSNLNLNAGSSRPSFEPTTTKQNSTSSPAYFTDPYAFDSSHAFVGSRYQTSAVRSVERSVAVHDNGTSYGYLSSSSSSAGSALLLLGGGDGVNRYAHLGERMALLFDVLVHLDAQGGGVARHYLLLRDFYLLASTLDALSTGIGGPGAGAPGRGVGSAVPPQPLRLTAELDRRCGLTWDDVLRSADKDRDGCIAYREWIAYGIEHPDVVHLLCEAVRRLPRQVAAAMKRLGMAEEKTQSGSATLVIPSLPIPSMHDPQHSGNSGALGPSTHSTASSTVMSYPCRIHSASGSGGPRSSRVVPVSAMEEDLIAYEGRCEACRELAAQSPEERLRWAAKPTPFVSMLRQ